MKKITNLLIILVFTTALASAQTGLRPTETGGVLSYEQAAYDVLRYDIDLRVLPAEKAIRGVTTVTARIVQPIDVFVLDLDTPLAVSKVSLMNGENASDLRFERRGGKIFAHFPLTKQPGETVSVRVTYGGVPRVAPNPPWVGGFMWEQTADGSPWIVTAYQNDGADVLFPCKDHPSDKAETVSVRVTVPEGLYAASVGVLQNIEQNADGTRTFHWLMSNPIPNYGVVLNIAPYKLIEDEFRSVAGETFPVIFYVLPESYEEGRKLLDETKKYLRFFEQHLGPYPFRAEKLGIVETPHLGMEHSTIIAYGNKFRFEEDGFDWLLFHELGHEWWANLVTASDWRDFWIHEGFQSFLDTYYMEKTRGKEAYFRAMKNRARNTRNRQPVAPREPKFSYQVYMAAPDYLQSDGDIYGKGAVVLHTLRYLIGDEAFFRSLRRMAYPLKEMESYTDGRQTRFVNTDDFLYIAEKESGRDLDWFFEIYLRQPALPELDGVKIVADDAGGTATYFFRWITPERMPFPMPLEVLVDGELKRLEFVNGTARLTVPKDAELTIDPNGWILRKASTDAQNP